MAEQKTVKVTLKRTYGQGARKYGPGEDIEVPEDLARTLGVHPDQKATPPKGKKGATK